MLHGKRAGIEQIRAHGFGNQRDAVPDPRAGVTPEGSMPDKTRDMRGIVQAVVDERATPRGGAGVKRRQQRAPRRSPHGGGHDDFHQILAFQRRPDAGPEGKAGAIHPFVPGLIELGLPGDVREIDHDHEDA